MPTTGGWKPTADRPDPARHGGPIHAYLAMVRSLHNPVGRGSRFSTFAYRVDVGGERFGATDAEAAEWSRAVAVTHHEALAAVADLCAAVAVRLNGRADHPVQHTLIELGTLIEGGRGTDTPPDPSVCDLLWRRVVNTLAMPLNGVLATRPRGPATPLPDPGGRKPAAATRLPPARRENDRVVHRQPDGSYRDDPAERSLRPTWGRVLAELARAYTAGEDADFGRPEVKVGKHSAAVGELRRNFPRLAPLIHRPGSTAGRPAAGSGSGYRLLDPAQPSDPACESSAG